MNTENIENTQHTANTVINTEMKPESDLDLESESSCEGQYPDLYDNCKKPDAWIWNQHIHDICYEQGLGLEMRSNGSNGVNGPNGMSKGVNNGLVIENELKCVLDTVDKSEYNLYKTLQHEIYTLTNIMIALPIEE